MVAVDSIYVPVRGEPEALRLAALSDGVRMQFLTAEEAPPAGSDWPLRW